MEIRRDNGQATVELAFSIILLAILFLLLFQIGLVARDQVLVTQAAREGARAAAVDPDRGVAVAAAGAATGLADERMSISVGERPDMNGMVEVDVTYRSRVVMPVVHRVLIEPTLRAKAAMRVEGVTPST